MMAARGFMMTIARCVGVLGLALVCGCVTHSFESKPIEFKPIQIKLDINLRVQRELDDFFEFEEEAGEATKDTEATTTRPTK